MINYVGSELYQTDSLFHASLNKTKLVLMYFNFSFVGFHMNITLFQIDKTTLVYNI